MNQENLILGKQLEPCFVTRVDSGDFRKLEWGLSRRVTAKSPCTVVSKRKLLWSVPTITHCSQREEDGLRPAHPAVTPCASDQTARLHLTSQVQLWPGLWLFSKGTTTLRNHMKVTRKKTVAMGGSRRDGDCAVSYWKQDSYAGSKVSCCLLDPHPRF